MYDWLAKKLEPDEGRRMEKYYIDEDHVRKSEAESWAWDDEKERNLSPLTYDDRMEE